MYWASYVSGAGVLQRSETVAPTRGIRNWDVSVTGFDTASGETPYMDVSTVGNVLSVGIWKGRWRTGWRQ